MNVTPALLIAATGCPPDRAAEFAPHLTETCTMFAINTPARLAAFLAQIGHESSSLRYTSEIWGPTPAQARYEGRADLGNTQPGDGVRYRGHGLIQTTGRANHRAVRDRLRARNLDAPDFDAAPHLLAEPRWAALSAGDYWDMRGLNALADAGQFEQITRRINGGLNGQADRLARHKRALAALGATPATPPQLENQTMPIPAIVAALLPSLISAAPKLAAVFTGSADSREGKVAEVVFGIAKDALGATNEQDVADKLQADPQAAATLRAAVESNWFAISEAGGGGIAGARKAEAEFMRRGDSVLKSPSFLVAVGLLPLVYLVVGAVVGLFGAPFSEDVRAAIANGIVGLILGGLIGYYYGQTTSRNRAP